MRIFTTLLFTAVVMCGGMSFGQIAAWDFFPVPNAATPATYAAEVFNANMDASNDITRGANAPASAGTSSFRTQGFQNDGIAVTNQDYFQVTLSAATGYELSLSTIDADVRGTATYAAAPGVSMQFAYSTDGTNFTLIGAPQVVTTATASLTQINLSGIAALQDLPAATTVTLRFYASGQTATGGWGFYSAADNDFGLAIGGTVDAVASPCSVPAPAAPAVAVCEGGQATLSATASQSGTLNWYNLASGGSSLQTGATYQTSALTTTTSYWVDETVSGCPASPRTEVVVTVNPLPTVNAGMDVTVCSGANVTLTGSGAVDYTWNNGVTNGVPFAATSTTIYTVTGTNANGCTNIDDVLVTVSGTAPAVNAGADQQVCAGGQVSLTATGAGTFSWDNGVQQAMPFTPTSTMTYTVTVDDGVCTNTDQVVVTVFEPSVAGTATISDVDACLNDVLTGTVTGYTGSVEWFIQAPGFPVYQSAGTTPTLTTPAIPLAGSYNVKVQVTNGVCPMATSNVVVVVVNPLPTVNAGTDQTVCAGTAVTLTGAGAATYTWNNSVTNNTPFTPAATATYTVTGTDSHGCTNTDQVVVTVTPLPTVGAGADQVICAGEQVTLTGTGATTYAWNNGVTNNTAFTPTATTTYTVTGTSNGCTNTDQVVVTVNALPTATATFANGTLTATPAGQTYQWINCTTSQPIAGATNATYTPTVAGSYSVEVTNSSGCSATSACVSATVGLEEAKADAAISLFPNPTKGKVTLAVSTNDHVNVTVYNALGKVVSTINHAQNGTVIDLSENQSGVYMIQVKGEKGSSIHRIVKN